LAIVAELTRAHGWSVTVEESRAGGARFVFHTDSNTGD
jgi:signal transduction histidine kinase